MLSEKLAKNVINEAIKTGADFAEIYYEDTTSKSISVENGLVDVFNTSNINGVGLRLLKENRSVYGYSNDISSKSLLKLAHDLSCSFNGEKILDDVESFKKVSHRNFNKKVTSLFDVEESKIIDLIKKSNSIVSSYDPRIVNVKTGFSMSSTTAVIFNSRGEKHVNNREYGRTYIMSVATQNGKIETHFDGPGGQGGWE